MLMFALEIALSLLFGLFIFLIALIPFLFMLYLAYKFFEKLIFSNVGKIYDTPLMQEGGSWLKPRWEAF